MIPVSYTHLDVYKRQIETSLDGELTDGVFTTAEEPFDVKIRAAADGETVEHTAKLDGEVLEGTPEEDGWTTYVLSFAQSGSYMLDISAADEEQSRTIVYQAQDTLSLIHICVVNDRLRNVLKDKDLLH